MEAWKIIQECELVPVTGLYNRDQFLLAIAALPNNEFNRFCKEYLHLLHFYDTNKEAWATDQLSIVQLHPGRFWHLKKIDFDSPMNFVRIV